MCSQRAIAESGCILFCQLLPGMRKKLFLQVDRRKRSSQSDLFPYSPFFLPLPTKLGVNPAQSIRSTGKVRDKSKLPSKSVLLIMAKVCAKCFAREITFFFFFLSMTVIVARLRRYASHYRWRGCIPARWIILLRRHEMHYASIYVRCPL